MNFSLQSYRAIIEQTLASGYRFKPFTLEDDAESGCIYLRHDIDYSLGMGLELARVNADLGVAGTFFVLLHSHVYNLLSYRSLHTVRRIHELGQHIGLHFAIPPFATDNLEARLHGDFQIIHQHLPVLSRVFTWHNPTPELLEQNLQSDHVAGLANAYAARFTRNIAYLSDSNMRHSADHFLHVLRTGEHPVLQLLFHPLNWVAGGNNMRDVFARTWPHLIREQEQDMHLNRSYQAMFPHGMPNELLQSFTDLWFRAAESSDRGSGSLSEAQPVVAAASTRNPSDVDTITAPSAWT